MSGLLMTLVISTPLEVVLRADGVRSVRAEDESGSFGVWPGHVPLLTVLRACVLHWRRAEGPWSYCALRGGVMTTDRDGRIAIACRKAIPGTDLAALQGSIARQTEIEEDAARTARIRQAQMHTQAIRQIMRHISGGGGPAADPIIDGLSE